MARCDECVHFDVCYLTEIDNDIRDNGENPNCLYFSSAADVVPREEVDKIIAEWAYLHADTVNKLDNAKAEVAREIFEEIETALTVHAFTSKSEDYIEGACDTMDWVDSKLAELRKKYLEGEDNGKH